MFIICNENTKVPVKVWLEDESKLEGMECLLAE